MIKQQYNNNYTLSSTDPNTLYEPVNSIIPWLLTQNSTTMIPQAIRSLAEIILINQSQLYPIEAK
jgi:hypothetical protein